MAGLPLVEAIASAGDSLKMPFVKEGLVAALALAKSMEVEETAAVETATNDVAVQPVNTSVSFDEEVKVQLCSMPEAEVAGTVLQSEIARIGE